MGGMAGGGWLTLGFGFDDYGVKAIAEDMGWRRQLAWVDQPRIHTLSGHLAHERAGAYNGLPTVSIRTFVQRGLGAMEGV